MLTTCPECRTTFRVGQAQLDDKRGLVRCGHCAAVFNAYDTLLPELSAPPLNLAGQEADVPAVDSPALVMAVEEVEEHDSTPPEAGPVAAPELILRAPDVLADQYSPDSEREFVETPIDQAVTPETSPFAGAPRTDNILFTPLPTPASRDKRRVLSGLFWGLVSLCLALILVLQLVYFLRAELAASVPGMRPFVLRFCSYLGCDLPLAKDSSALRIESTALETDPEDKFRATLSVTFSNRSDQPVAWPYLVLMLTDTRDLPIAQRPFAPREYLPQDGAADEGMLPGHEFEAQLPLELKGLSAYGYKLDIQYP